MTLSVPYSTTGTTISTTEISLTNLTSTIASRTEAGVFQAWIDFGPTVKGDLFRIRVYEKVRSADSQQVVYEAAIAGQVTLLWTHPPLLLINGWDFSLLKLAGTDRSLAWTVRKSA